MSCPKDCNINLPHKHQLIDSNVHFTCKSVHSYPFQIGRFIVLGEDLRIDPNNNIDDPVTQFIANLNLLKDINLKRNDLLKAIEKLDQEKKIINDNIILLNSKIQK